MGHARGQRGFALLIVLWWTVLLAVLATHLALASRLDARRAGNLRDATMAETLADGALQESLFHLLDRSPNGWEPIDARHPLSLPGARAEVEIQSEAGKLGLNAASPALIAALLQRLGVGPRDAARLGDAVLDWRTETQQARPLGAKEAEYRAGGFEYAPPQSDFETVDELAYVRGMTPSLLERLKPYVSVYQTDEPDAALAPPPLRQALRDVGETPDLPPDGLVQLAVEHVLDITVSVVLDNGVRAVRHTVVRLSPNRPPAGYRILEHY